MKKFGICVVLCIALMGGTVSCEKVTFPQEEPGDGADVVPEVSVTPDSTGNGTAGAPATVADLMEREAEFMGRSCWVAGYIVGYTERTMKNAAFTTEGAVQSNVLLAQTPWTDEADGCVPVELKTDKWKKALSLAHQPENLGRRVAVHGLVNTYFSVTGVRSIDGAVWLSDGEPTEKPEGSENDSLPVSEPEPEDSVAEPQKPETGSGGEHPADEAGPQTEESLIYINKVLLQRVDRMAALRAGERYMLGTVPDREGMRLVAASLQYGTGQRYRRVIEAQGEADHLVTEQGVAPAIFVLEETEEGYRLRDELTGAYLAYDVRGDASSASWLPLYTLPGEELDKYYQAAFQIEPADGEEQIRTAELVKYSAADRRTCLLRYNSGGVNFKLNYQKSGVPVCLYLLK